MGPRAGVWAGLILVCLSLAPIADGLCNATCGCDNLQFGLCLDQGVCGNTPCEGPTPNAECPQDAPASLTAEVIGDATIALYWDDPVNTDLVDEYNLWYSTIGGATACAALADGAPCSYTLPGEETPRSGECGAYSGGSLYCWLDLFPKLLAVLPCVKPAPDDPTCNYQTLASGVEVGRHFYFRVNAGRCCWNSIIDTPGCTGCTDALQNLNCPQSPTYAYADVVALGFPSAVQGLAVVILADRSVRLTWAAPADTGSLTSDVNDLDLVRVTASLASDFSTAVSVTDLANTALQRDEAGLTPGVTYYFLVETGNAACNAAIVCGGTANVSTVAVGIASAPVGLASALVAGSPGAFDLTWAAPVDTGQGNGAASTAEPVIQYNVLVNGVVVASVNTLAHQVTGLVVGTTYSLAVRAVNRAGNGVQASISRVGTGYPSAPLTFVASVNAVDGPLKIRLTWSTPSSTGRGPNNVDEELTGYRVLLATSNEVVGGTGYTSDFATSTTELDDACNSTATCTTTLVLTFGAARALPHVVRVLARNPVGFGPSAETFEQAVALPSAALSLTATVSAPNAVGLAWLLPTDTGVGDQTRPLTQIRIARSYGTTDLSCTLNCTSCAGTCYYSQIGACCSQVIAAGSTAATISGLPQSETRFYFAILASNDAGFGPASNAANEQGVTVPSAPTALAASYPAVLTIAATWALPADTGVGAGCTGDCRPLTGYNITVTGSNAVVVLAEGLAPGLTARTVGGLSHALTYTVRVTASNDAGASTTAAQLAGLIPREVPTAPTSFTATVGTTPYRINTAWGVPLDTGATGTSENITNYILELDTVSSTFLPNNTVPVCNNGNACSGTVACSCLTLSAAVTLSARRTAPYYLRVQAVNQYGAGPFSTANALSVGVPSQPLNTSAAVTGTRLVKITWAPPSDFGIGAGTYFPLTDHIIQRSYDDGAFTGCALGTNTLDACASMATSACCTFASLGPVVTSATLTVPSAGPPFYFFRAFAVNRVGTGLASLAASEQGLDPPGPPQGLTVTTIGPAQFTVDWSAPLDTGLGDTSRPLTGYVVEVCQAPVYDFSVIYLSVSLGPAVLTYTKTDFIGGTNYTFRVKATNDAGPGTASNAVTVPAIAIPKPPQAFAAVVTAPLSIALSWLVPADTGFGDSTTAPIREYILNVSTDNFTTPGTTIFVGAPSNFSFTHTGLTKGLTYYYELFATTDAGTSDATRAFEQGITAPSAPTNLVLAVSAPLTINVTWAQPTDSGLGDSVRPLTEVRLEVIASATALAGPLNWASPTSTFTVSNVLTAQLTGLTEGFYYYVRVLGANDAGDGPASTEESERGLALPGAPTGVATAVSNPSEIFVTWAASLNSGLGSGVGPTRLLTAGGFVLNYATNPSFINLTAVSLANTATNYTASSLIKAATYYFRVFAVNDAGVSPSSNVASRLAIELPTAPLGPAVVVSTASQRQLILTWQLSADTGAGGQTLALTQYRVQESQDDATFSAPTDVLVAYPTLTLTRSTLNKGSVYHYRVYARNQAGESVASVNVSEMAIDKPSVPLNPVLVVSGSLRLLFTWDTPTDTGNGNNVLPRLPLARYTVQVDKVSSAMGFPLTPIPVIPDLTTNYTRSGALLIQGTMYYMTVIAYNAAGASPASTVVSATAVAIATRPLLPSAVVTNPLEIKVTWSGPTNTGGVGTTWPLLYYRLTVSSNLTYLDETVVVESLSLTRVEQGLTKGKQYYYRIYAVNVAGVSLPSATVTEQGVALPASPTNLVISHTAELQLTVTWDAPVDTGTGGLTRPLLRYVLEEEHLIGGTNGTFAGSPFPDEGPCFVANTPTCDPSASSFLALSLFGLSRTHTQAGLVKGNTHYYRVLAVNSAGASNFSAIAFDQALVLPSEPQNLDVTLTVVALQAAYLITWTLPAETGAGVTPIGQPPDLTGAPGTARGGTQYRAQAAIDGAFDGTSTVEVTTNLFATKTGLVEGRIYFFRVAAINEVGQGLYRGGATSGPQIEDVQPTEGPARGGTWVTVTGRRFGTSAVNLQVLIGQGQCSPIVMLTLDESFKCLSPPGTGGNKVLTLDVIGLVTKFSPAFAYQGPQVTGLFPTEADSEGGVAVTVLGYNFGAEDTTPVVWLQGKGSDACKSTVWASDSSLVCWVGPATATTTAASSAGVRVDGQVSPINARVQLLRTGLQTFLQTCPSSASQACFECAVKTCYLQKENDKTLQGGESLDECELLAAKHCDLDQAQ